MKRAPGMNGRGDLFMVQLHGVTVCSELAVMVVGNTFLQKETPRAAGFPFQALKRASES
jgi:hypothetical protein